MRTIKARLHALEYLADGILGIELRPQSRAERDEWPVAIAGSHIDLHLPGGLTRSYSLVNAQGENHRYVIAVSRDAKSRGGSKHLHEKLRVGEIISISEPRNSFVLKESAAHSVFIAGGIGITPLWSMVQRLSQIGAPWTLHYSAQSPEKAAYVEQLSALAADAGGTLHLNFDGGQRDKMLDLAENCLRLSSRCRPVLLRPDPDVAGLRRRLQGARSGARASGIFCCAGGSAIG